MSNARRIKEAREERAAGEGSVELCSMEWGRERPPVVACEGLLANTVIETFRWELAE